MKIYRVLLFLFIGFILLFISTQALASPVRVPNAKDTPVTKKTPKPKGTEKPDRPDKHDESDKPDKPDQPDKPDKPNGKREHFKGTVTAVDADSLTLTLRDGTSVTIGLTADTHIKIPGSKNSEWAGIAAGMSVSVQAIRDENGNLITLIAMVKPDKPSKIHRVGMVTEYTPGVSITIQDKDGNTFTFPITGAVILLPTERAGQLSVGSRVTIIAPREPATGGVTVNGIVIHPAVP